MAFGDIKHKYGFLTKSYRANTIYYQDLLKSCFAFHNLERFSSEFDLKEISQDWFTVEDDRPQPNIQSIYASIAAPENIEPVSLINLPPTSIFITLNSAYQRGGDRFPALNPSQPDRPVTPLLDSLDESTEIDLNQISTGTNVQSSTNNTTTTTTTSSSKKQTSKSLQSESEEEEDIRPIIHFKRKSSYSSKKRLILSSKYICT